MLSSFHLTTQFDQVCSSTTEIPLSSTSSSFNSTSLPKPTSKLYTNGMYATLSSLSSSYQASSDRVLHILRTLPYAVVLLHPPPPVSLSRHPSNQFRSSSNTGSTSPSTSSASSSSSSSSVFPSSSSHFYSSSTPSSPSSFSPPSFSSSSSMSSKSSIVLPTSCTTPSSPRWKWVHQRGHSALHSGLHSLEPHVECIYIGGLGPILNEHEQPIEHYNLTEADKEEITQLLFKECKSIPLFLDGKLAHGHYDGYCKIALWPLFHYILWNGVMDAKQESNDWEAYVKVNSEFSKLVKSTYKPGDLIWIHDYHLLLAPSMLRESLPSANIGLFLHTPFPSSEVFRCLPRRSELLEGILGATLVGFQTYAYARHFVSCCTRVLGLESTPTGVEFHGHHVAIGIFPVGIDVDRALTLSKSESVQMKAKALRELYHGKKIIVGRDKLDQTKGVYPKLMAFEKFLDMYPEWRHQVVLIQVTASPPSHEHTKLEAKVSELVSHINGKYGSISFSPVHHIHRSIDRDEFYALLTVADVALITPVRDGMNTTSHEFVVCQQETMSPLILSEFTGSAGSFSSALLVNPWDYIGVAQALNEALCMSKEEKMNRHRQMFNHVSLHTAPHWARTFIKSLSGSSKLPTSSHTTPLLDQFKCTQAYLKATSRLIMFDYDGTLTPIVKHPNAAYPTPELLETLTQLCKDPKNVVFVISGRDQATLETWLGQIPGLGLSAEHGCFLKYPNTGQWTNFSKDMDLTWKNDVIDIFSYYAERTQGSFIEHKRCSVTWHYRLADPNYGAFQAKECQNHLENAVLSKLPIEVLVGKKNLEVRPFAINKGEIVKRLLTTMVSSNRGRFDFVFCVGDDKTDEDMFKVLNKDDDQGNWSVTIGQATKRTTAGWHLLSPQHVISVVQGWIAPTKVPENDPIKGRPIS